MASSLPPADWAHLRRAIDLGREGWGWVQPNPMVGCVIVSDGEVVGEGYHRRFGEAHAEVEAIRAAGEQASGATAYVGLEPCRHEGKTPPCTDALISAGVTRVIFAFSDPGLESGGGAEVLRAAGIEVHGPLLSAADAWRCDPAFYQRFGSDEPFLAIKLAVSSDGFISEGAGRRTDITGAESLDETHRMRAGFDAILIGARTARVDNSLLTVRRGMQTGKAPRRVVLSSDGMLPTDLRLFMDSPAILQLVVGSDTPSSRVRGLELNGAKVSLVDTVPGPDGTLGLDLAQVLELLHEEGVQSVLCEGGAKLASALLRARHVHRLYLFEAPDRIGPGGVPAFTGLGQDIWSEFHPSGPHRAMGRDRLRVLDRTPAWVREESCSQEL